MANPKSLMQDASPDAVQSALRTLDAGSSGIAALATALRGPLGAPFADAVELIRQAKGRVIVTGLGKSGHIGRKVAATLASTGTPAFFVHTAEASHGDLGMITGDDVVIALSNSGESPEVVAILPLLDRKSTRLNSSHLGISYAVFCLKK